MIQQPNLKGVIEHRIARASEPQPPAGARPQLNLDAFARSQREAGMQQALRLLRDGVLPSWIDGARANHDACGHRGEMDPCWERFESGDIRRMVDDVATELGIKL